jgi:hypothetical protein
MTRSSIRRNHQTGEHRRPLRAINAVPSQCTTVSPELAWPLSIFARSSMLDLRHATVPSLSGRSANGVTHRPFCASVQMDCNCPSRPVGSADKQLGPPAATTGSADGSRKLAVDLIRSRNQYGLGFRYTQVRECTIGCRSSRARTSTIVSQFPDPLIATIRCGRQRSG